MTLTSLDIVAARARHAEWLTAVRPQFLGTDQEEGPGCVSVHAACHPLLLQRVLPTLPVIPGADDPDESHDEADWHANASKAAHEKAPAVKEGWQPQTVNFEVPAGVSVAAVTGPNTGACTWLLHHHGLCIPCGHAAMACAAQHVMLKWRSRHPHSFFLHAAAG